VVKLLSLKKDMQFCSKIIVLFFFVLLFLLSSGQIYASCSSSEYPLVCYPSPNEGGCASAGRCMDGENRYDVTVRTSGNDYQCAGRPGGAVYAYRVTVYCCTVGDVPAGCTAPTPYCRSDSLCDSTVSDFTCNAGSCKPWERRTGIVKRYQYDPAASSCTTTPCDNVSDICTSDCRCNDSCPTSTPTPTATSTPACFLSGTQISTPRGDKPIETLTAGDRVWSFDEQTGKVVANEVEELVTSQTDAYYIIETASGRQIKATGDHPVYTGRQLSLRESLWTRIRGLFHM
jgi:hypothetical protein